MKGRQVLEKWYLSANSFFRRSSSRFGLVSLILSYASGDSQWLFDNFEPTGFRSTNMSVVTDLYSRWDLQLLIWVVWNQIPLGGS